MRIVKFKILLSYLIFFSTSILSQPEFYSPNYPIVDLGQIFEGENITFPLKILNTGNSPLILSDFKKSCGCIKIENFDGMMYINPQASTNLLLNFKSNSFKGEVHKNLFFRTNDDSKPQITFEIKATIIQEIEISPPYLWISRNKSNEYHSVFYIKNLTLKAVEIDTIFADPDNIHIKYDKNIILPGEKKSFSVNIHGLPNKRLDSNIFIFFNGLHIAKKIIKIYENEK